MGFTENFNYCLEERGYSAYRFAKIIGVNIQSVVNWKTGTTQPHYSKKVKIADHFGITLAELDGDELPVLPNEGIKKERPADGEALIRDLPEDIQQIIRICMNRPELASALLNLAKQIEKD